MPEPNDLRPAPRFEVTVFVGHGDEQRPFGRTRNVSATGMFLETDQRPVIDSLQEIALVWGDETYFCRARVVRHTADGIGLMFIEPDEGFRHTVAEIIGAQQ